jgi:diacylglycerol O-acyltransferase / wax synthase
MARLSPLDASFLRVESPTAHMHVGWLSHLELPPGEQAFDVDRLARTLASRLHLTPRFRQIVTPTPLGLGEPTWTDDPRFDLRRHIYVAASGSHAARLADDFLSRPLPRDRPLWSLLVVPRTEPGRAALIGKVHHAMVDGVAAVELGILLFDVEPDPPAQDAPAWRPQAARGAIPRAWEALGASAQGNLRAAGSVARRVTAARDAVRAAESGGRAALSLAGDVLHPAPPSSLNPPIGPRRALRTQRLPMADLEALKQAHGVKLNDVVLTVAAGALRQLAMMRGEEPDDLRVMVPVSTRVDGEEGGNRITFCFVRLPTSVADPLARLRQTRATTVDMKGDVAGSDLLLRSLGHLPAPLKTATAKLAASPRLYNLTISNVPGPRMPLYAAGARVESVFPVIPLSDGHALSFGALSYDGGMHFTAYADPAALPEVDALPSLLSSALLDLVEASRRRRPPRHLRRRPAIRGERTPMLTR